MFIWTKDFQTAVVSVQILLISLVLEVTLQEVLAVECRSFDGETSIHKWPVNTEEVLGSYMPLSYHSNGPLSWSNNCQGSSIFVYKFLISLLGLPIPVYQNPGALCSGLVFGNACAQNSDASETGLIYLGSHSTIGGTHSLLTFPKTVLQGSSEVSSAAFASSYLLVVIQGRLFSYNLNTKLVVTAKGIVGNVTNVASFQCCHSDRQWCQDRSNIVVAYNKIQEVGIELKYYISYDAGLNFIKQQISASHQGQIHGASLLHSHSEIVFLVKSSPTTAQFVHTSYHHPETSSEDSLGFTVEGDQIGFIQLQGDIDSLLVWDNKKILYSISAGQAVLPVNVFPSNMSMESVSSQPLDHQQVTQVVSDEQRSFAILTDDNEVILGREGILPQGVELDVTAPNNATCSLHWIDSVHLNMLCPEPNQKSLTLLDFSSTIINIQEHITQMDSTCPLQSFDGDFNNELFYLDIGMSMNITATLIPEKWQENWFLVGISNPSIISVQSDTKEEEMLATGLSNISVNAHINLKASSLPNGQKEDGRGTSALWMTAMNTSLVCPQNPFLVAQIAAECPPNKNIRVRNVELSCDEMKGYSYVIKKEHYDASFLAGGLGDTIDQEDLTIYYDYAKLGCPVKEYYGDKFKPTIDLYHDDMFVEEILTDYVIHEIHGVFTYGYTRTAGQVGCISSPQSWTSMLLQQSDPDPKTAWTRKNYRSCFVNGSELAEPNQSYEVLSNGSSNLLHWADYNTIYVFHVTVVDPDYSFCELSTEFAVQIYGALPKAATPPMRIVISTCGIGLGVLAAGFIVHAYKCKKGSDNEDEQINQEHE